MAFCAWGVCVCDACFLSSSFSSLPPAAWHFLCFLSPAITAWVNTYSWQPFSPSPFYFSPSLSPCLSSLCLSLTIDTDTSLLFSLLHYSLLSSPRPVSLFHLLTSLRNIFLLTLPLILQLSITLPSPLLGGFKPTTLMERQMVLSRVKLYTADSRIIVCST